MCRCNVCGREFALEEGYYAVDFSSGRTFRFCDKPNCFEVGIQVQTAQSYLEDAPKNMVQLVEDAIFGEQGKVNTSSSIYSRLLDLASELFTQETGKYAPKNAIEDLLKNSPITEEVIKEFVDKYLF